MFLKELFKIHHLTLRGALVVVMLCEDMYWFVLSHNLWHSHSPDQLQEQEVGKRGVGDTGSQALCSYCLEGGGMCPNTDGQWRWQEMKMGVVTFFTNCIK